MNKSNRECYPQDKCPLCGKFAIGYGSRRLKNNSKVMPASAEEGDFIFFCSNCGARLVLISDLFNDAEAPAAISG